MSTENRKKVLLGFGVLAVAVVVALAIWAPKFRNEEASGAIGAVQKHRAPQITRQDVVLGDEAARRQQKVLYADFLNDAAKLQAASAQLGMMAQRQAESRDYAAVRKMLDDLSDEAESRYFAYAREALAAVKAMNRAELANEIEEAAAVAQRAELSQIEMEQLNMKLAHIAEQLEAKAAAARGAKAAHRELAEAVEDLQSRKFAEARSNLELAARELNLRAEFDSRSLQADIEYLEATALELKTVKNVEELIGMMASKAQAENKLADIQMELASQAQRLEARAAKNIQQLFNEDTQMAAMLREMDAQVAEARKYAESKAQDFNRLLGEIQQELQVRETEFAAHAAADVEFELAAIEAYAGNLTQLGRAPELGRLVANLNAQLASKSPLTAMLQNEEDLAAKAAQLDSRFRPSRRGQARRRRAY
jgi:hypothetical protein